MKTPLRPFVSRFANRALLPFVLLTTLAAQTNYTPYHFTTLAGYVGPGSQNGVASAARFNGPSGMAIDGDGNLFVADQNNHTIRKITPAGVVTTFAGSAGVAGTANGRGAAARFTSPVDVALDGFGNLYVLELSGDTIRKISPDGVVTTFAVTGVGSGIAVDATGNVYVTSGGIFTVRVVDSGRVRKITPDGVQTTLAGADTTRLLSGAWQYDGTGPDAHFASPAGIVADRNGNLFLVDLGYDFFGGTIRKITPGGVVTTLAGTAGSGSADGPGNVAGFLKPGNLATDASGNVFISDTGGSTIRKMTADGTVTTFAGTALHPGFADAMGAAAQFRGPKGVVVDANGNLFVADAGNNTIRKITIDGTVSTVAGLASVSGPGTADGTGPHAQFNNPSGVAVDASGNVYVADTNNHEIRKITPAGVVTAFGSAPGTPIVIGSGYAYGQPSGVAVDAGGNVFVADPNSSIIWQVAAGGTITTVAGIPGSTGSEDGTLAVARFKFPRGVAVDASGNIYVADTGNFTIRKIAPGGIVSTLAGLATYNAPFTDGTGAAARFVSPIGVAVDANGNVFVADSNTVRKVTPAGVVTTLAGSFSFNPTTPADGTGSAAGFRVLTGVAVDATGNVLVAEPDRIRRVTPAGVVTTLAVSAGAGAADGTGAAAHFGNVQALAADANGNVFVADSASHAILRGYPNHAPVAGSSTLTTPNNQTVTFTLPATDADGDPLAYTLASPTSGSVTVSGDQAIYTPAAGFVGTASFSFTATDGYATSASGSVSITVNPATTFLVNISSRGRVGAGNDALIAGFVLVGTAPKPVLIRAAGPALIGQNVSGTLAQPVVTLYRGTTRTFNQGWGTAGNAADVAASGTAVGAFSFAAGSKDSAILTTLNPGIYSAIVSSADGGTGVALVEVYDADTGNPSAHPVNLSTRGQVGTGDNLLIAGVAVTGASPQKLLIRAVGPTLASFQLTGVLADPQFHVYQGSTVVAQNTGWSNDPQVQTAATQTGAFALPAGSNDAAAVVTLAPGNYTVIVSSRSGATGLALVEVYQVP